MVRKAKRAWSGDPAIVSLQECGQLGDSKERVRNHGLHEDKRKGPM